MSRLRRGCPFGFDVSQTISPSKPVSSAIELGELADRDLVAAAEVDRLGAVVPLCGEQESLGAVVDVQELARRRSVAPEHDSRRRSRLDHLPDQGRNDVRGLEVEVVARPVQVHRQEVDRVRAVLLAVRLRPDEQRLLRDAVRRVRLLRVAVPQLVLVERHRRELRVGADRAEDDRLPDTVQARLLEHVRAHDEVRVPVAARVRAVRADAADLGREMEDELGLAHRRRGARRRPRASGRSRGGARRTARSPPSAAARRDASRGSRLRR